MNSKLLIHWIFSFEKNVWTAFFLSSIFKNMSIGEINKYHNIHITSETTIQIVETIAKGV